MKKNVVSSIEIGQFQSIPMKTKENSFFILFVWIRFQF